MKHAHVRTQDGFRPEALGLSKAILAVPRKNHAWGKYNIVLKTSGEQLDRWKNIRAVREKIGVAVAGFSLLLTFLSNLKTWDLDRATRIWRNFRVLIQKIRTYEPIASK